MTNLILYIQALPYDTLFQNIKVEGENVYVNEDWYRNLFDNYNELRMDNIIHQVSGAKYFYFDNDLTQNWTWYEKRSMYMRRSIYYND